MFYTVSATIDDEVYLISTNVPEDELEGELQHLSRKHEFKNVTRFEITEETKNDSILDYNNKLK